MSGTFQAGSITGTIGLDETPQVQALKRAKEATADYKRVAEQSLTEAGEKGAEGFLRGLKQQFGRRSVFNESLELLTGGGVIAGIGLAAHQFADVGEKIANLTDNFRKGQTSASEFTGEIARSLPILGDMVKGFDGIREAITGEKSAIDEQTEAAKRADDALNAFKKSQDAAWEGFHRITDEVVRLNQQLELLRSPAALKPFLENAFAAGDTAAGLKADLYGAALKAHPLGLSLPDDVGKFDPASIEAAYKGNLQLQSVAAKALADAQELANRDRALMQKAFNDHPLAAYTQLKLGEWQPAVDAMKSADAAQAQLTSIKNAGATLKSLDDDYQQFLKGTATAQQIERAKDADAGIATFKKFWGELADSGLSFFRKMDEEWNKQKEEVGRLRESVMTPNEKFAADITKWQALEKSGGLDAQTFNRLAWKDYNEQLQALSGGAGDTRRGIQAEDVFGRRTVTTADVPQPVSQTAENTRETAELLGEMVDLMKTEASAPPAPPLATFMF